MTNNVDTTEVEAEPLEDEVIICRDCKAEFVFEAGEQQFFFRRGLLNRPVRCAPCRAKRKAAMAARGLGER